MSQPILIGRTITNPAVAMPDGGQENLPGDWTEVYPTMATWWIIDEYLEIRRAPIAEATPGHQSPILAPARMVNRLQTRPYVGHERKIESTPPTTEDILMGKVP